MQSFVLGAATLALVVVFAWGDKAARAEERRGAVLANTCFSCHGTEGRSSGAMPSIEGKSAAYISETLMRFRDGSKASTVMSRIAKGFTDDEIAALATFFSGQK